MLSLGLSSSEKDSLYDTLAGSHRIQVELRILDRDEGEISSLTAPISKMLSGSVQVDSTAAISRSLNCVVVDPKRKLRFEADSPAHGALYADRFLVAVYQVWVDDLDDFIEIPVFHGPLSSFARNGAEVTLEAQGKESLMLDPHFATFGYSIQKNTRLDDAIREVARKAGETKFNLPNLHHKLNRPRIVGRQAEPWLVLTNTKDVPGFTSRHTTRETFPGGWRLHQRHEKVPGLVDTVPGHYTAFYNARGQLCVRKLNRHSVFTFKEGDPDKPSSPAHLIADSPPQISYDITAFRNYVVVDGGKAKGKKPANGHASLPPAHPMSPHRLSRNGKPRYMTEFVTADNLDTDHECDQRAREVLNRLSTQGVDISFAALPLPMLEENDVITLQTAEYSIDFQVRQYTIPLTSDEAMTIGRHERVKLHRRRHRTGGRAGPPGGRGGHRPGRKHRHRGRK